MSFKVQTRDRDEADYSTRETYPDERSASSRARDLYQRGVYSVRVLKPDGTESLLWCKPEFGGAQ